MIILQNGVFKEREEAYLDLDDRGCQFGDGVYEVVGVYEGAFFTLDEHLERLERSSREIRLVLPLSIEELKQSLSELAEKNGLENGSVYIQVTRGACARNHAFPDSSVRAEWLAYPMNPRKPSLEQLHGVGLKTSEDMRWLRCDIKSLNLLGNVMAKQEALENGCYEALLHRNGMITEGASTNFYVIKDGAVYTHPANNLILNGITRMKIKEICNNENIPFYEQPFQLGNLKEADEAFITSTTIEIVPVKLVDHQIIGSGVPGSLTRKLQELFKQEIQKEKSVHK
ncbi:D-amino-acid transaminase [Bacillus lacus]|uniref:D-alanine aminotransferase n=1 Tax=Metabacillus lacus TaxID=1983721 RepID=A0A7X2LY79_9BACI|nr:D-amino-acid transaminase [Metabacillus lacus]MRX71513.1 D-amino-acid transaminase [Metabacillus lacus]